MSGPGGVSSGLVAWYAADSAFMKSEYSHNDEVEEWDDLSGNDYHTTYKVFGSLPTAKLVYRTGGLNGRPYLGTPWDDFVLPITISFAHPRRRHATYESSRPPIEDGEDATVFTVMSLQIPNHISWEGQDLETHRGTYYSMFYLREQPNPTPPAGLTHNRHWSWSGSVRHRSYSRFSSPLIEIEHDIDEYLLKDPLIHVQEFKDSTREQTWDLINYDWTTHHVGTSDLPGGTHDIVQSGLHFTLILGNNEGELGPDFTWYPQHFSGKNAIYELIIYDRILDAQEREDVEKYLAARYYPPTYDLTADVLDIGEPTVGTSAAVITKSHYYAPEVLDHGLERLREATRFDLCTQMPTSYAEATSTYSLGNKTGYQGGDIVDTDIGRKVEFPLILDGLATGTGYVSHWALSDTNTSTLLAAGPLHQGFTIGSNFVVPPFGLALPKATS